MRVELRKELEEQLGEDENVEMTEEDQEKAEMPGAKTRQTFNPETRK